MTIVWMADPSVVEGSDVYAQLLAGVTSVFVDCAKVEPEQTQ